MHADNHLNWFTNVIERMLRYLSLMSDPLPRFVLGPRNLQIKHWEAHATSHKDTLESTWNTIHSPFYFRNLAYFQVTLFKKCWIKLK